MEKKPEPLLEKEMTLAQLDAEIGRLGKELITIEGELGRGSAETGGDSLDDQAVEENQIDQVTGLEIAKIRAIRERISELESEKRRRKAAA